MLICPNIVTRKDCPGKIPSGTVHLYVGMTFLFKRAGKTILSSLRQSGFKQPDIHRPTSSFDRSGGGSVKVRRCSFFPFVFLLVFCLRFDMVDVCDWDDGARLCRWIKTRDYEAWEKFTLLFVRRSLVEIERVRNTLGARP